MARLPRPHMSLSVKLAACLDALGFAQGEDIEWDHTFALGLRKRLPDGRYEPDANDPRYIRPKRKSEHAIKTRGNGATTAGSDVHLAAKIKRLTKSHEAFRQRLFAYDPSDTALDHIERRWKRKIRGRGFKRQERRA